VAIEKGPCRPKARRGDNERHIVTDRSTRCVLLADRHHGLMEGVRGLLETAFGTVFMVGDEASLIDGVERLEPSVTVVDLALAGGNWLQLLRTLRERSPASKVIALSMYDEFSVVRAAMGAGVNGFVLKRAIATDMLDAITSVLRGASYISPCIKEGGRNET
jgi:DNA-binding NarL/FixJ family response regulator